MQALRLLCLAAAVPAAAAGGAASSKALGRAGVTPIEQVLQMLNGMIATAKQEKHEEEVAFAKFQVWCTGTRDAATKGIQEGAFQIKQLTAEIASAKADAEVLAKEIEDLQAATLKATAEEESAKQVRDTEQADYEAQHKDFSESIDACKRAIEVLKARSADVPQSLLQVRNLRKLPAPAKAAIDSLISVEQGPPEAVGYESQSGGIVAMLEKLTLDFEDQRLALEKAEMNAKANYELLSQQLTGNVRAYKADEAKKTALKASRQERAATATGELESTKAAKAQDEKTLADTTAECNSRSQAFEKDQVTRSEEVKALEQAVGILAGNAVSGNAQTYLPQFIQVKSTALAHLRSRQDGEARQKLVEFLEQRAGKLSSRFLSLAAARASEDPFVKVRKMIQDMIYKLTEQANSEADHHAYCTSELATNQQTREDKAAMVEELAAKLDQLTADSARLAGEIAELSEGLAALRQQQAEATQMRNEERAINAKTVEDAKQAQTAVAEATQVLKNFYGKTSLLQGGLNLKAEMEQAGSGPYQGQQSESKGVFGLLEVILSDFARLEAQTLSSEDSSQAKYERFMADTNEAIAVKETTLEHAQSSKRQADESAQTTKKDLDLTQEELDRALEYYDTLKADCLDNGLNYEERVREREAEVQSLREALAMLTQQDLA